MNEKTLVIIGIFDLMAMLSVNVQSQSFSCQNESEYDPARELVDVGGVEFVVPVCPLSRRATVVRVEDENYCYEW